MSNPVDAPRPTDLNPPDLSSWEVHRGDKKDVEAYKIKTQGQIISEWADTEMKHIGVPIAAAKAIQP